MKRITIQTCACLWVVCASFYLQLLSAEGNGSKYGVQRASMVSTIERHAASAGHALPGGIDPAVLAVMGELDRHRFVPDRQQRYAYEDRPLPIGKGQTISQPYIVALMTHLIAPEKDHVVLEVGTGSGYQAAVVANLVGKVYSIEIIEALESQASSRLRQLGFDNITTRLGDGYHGWQVHAPFDSIVVTAAASHVPPPLVQQLRKGGRMIIPVGGRFATQQLLLIEKDAEGDLRTRQIAPVRFVPLTGDH